MICEMSKLMKGKAMLMDSIEMDDYVEEKSDSVNAAATSATIEDLPPVEEDENYLCISNIFNMKNDVSMCIII